MACSLSDAALGELIETANRICVAARACGQTESRCTFEFNDEVKAKLGATFSSLPISAEQLPVVFSVGRAAVAFAKLQTMATGGLSDTLAPGTRADQVWPSAATNISNHRSFIRTAVDDASKALACTRMWDSMDLARTTKNMSNIVNRAPQVACQWISHHAPEHFHQLATAIKDALASVQARLLWLRPWRPGALAPGS